MQQLLACVCNGRVRHGELRGKLRGIKFGREEDVIIIEPQVIVAIDHAVHGKISADRQRSIHWSDVLIAKRITGKTAQVRLAS